MKRIINLIAAALAFAAAPAAAQKLKPDVAEYKAVELKSIVAGKQKIDPAKAYIYIRSPQNRAQGIFLKTPNEAEIANYEAKWREELADARKDYPGKLKRWEVDAQTGRKRGDKPVEPTEESFAIDPIDYRMIVSFGPQFVFDKTEGADKSFSYLVELEPGEYTYHGPIFYLPGTQVFGQCFCMGSVRFEAKAGQITSLGDFLSLGWADRAALEQSTIERKLLPDRPAKATDWSVPASLASYPTVQAELRAAGKRNNFLRALVGRIPSVPGVLAYDRDVPLDLIGLAEPEAAARLKAETEAEGHVTAEAMSPVEAASTEAQAAAEAETATAAEPPTPAPAL